MSVPPGGALADVRVLDLTSVVMGPMATQILGDLGADVISVEDIGGDTNRFMGPGPHPQLSGVSLNLLRNKRNISLDLKHPDGREACLRLAERADIVITNLRPGPLGRLRLAYDDVRARNPRVIYCQAQGWPTDGQHGNRPAYDDVIQSAAGMADTYLQRDGVPAIVPSIVADKVSGLTIVYAVLAALHHRDRTGEGQRVEVPMVEAMQAFMLAEHGSAAIPEPPIGGAGYTRVLSPNRRPQRTADGWIHCCRTARRTTWRCSRRAASRNWSTTRGWRIDSPARRPPTACTATWSTCCCSAPPPSGWSSVRSTTSPPAR
jgi:crotonobetainyl-CoA:carnitine CoA-transferase CaiB-like acyl-CoA transferase